MGGPGFFELLLALANPDSFPDVLLSLLGFGLVFVGWLPIGVGAAIGWHARRRYESRV